MNKPEIIWTVKITGRDELTTIEVIKTEQLAYKRATEIILEFLKETLSHVSLLNADFKLSIIELYAIFQKGNYKEFYKNWQKAWNNFEITDDNKNVYVESADLISEIDSKFSKERVEFIVDWLKGNK